MTEKDVIEKRLKMVEGFMRGLLERSNKVLEEMNETFEGIRKYKDHCDPEYLMYLSEVTELVAQKSRDVESHFNLIIDDTAKTVEYFKEDLQYMKIYAESDLESLDVHELMDTIERRTEARIDVEMELGIYKKSIWDRHQRWLESARDHVEEIEYYESRGEQTDDDVRFMKGIKTTLLYNQIILDRLEKSSKEEVDAATFSRMWGDDETDDLPF